MSTKKLLVIANSHIDPVWLWNRSSGRCSWSTTIGNAVRMLTEYPDLKFTCSASTLYRWIEETNPGLFSDIVQLVREKRWEIVGGWEVQSDVILSRAKPLIKQAEFGKTYFQDRFDVDVRIAYNVDAFGHSAGLPTILNACGFDYYVYGRSQPTPNLFRWCAESGASVTALHLDGYGTSAAIDRDAFVKRVQNAWNQDLEQPILFLGVGDHGGGIFRHHMKWLSEASVPFEFATLEEYFSGVSGACLPEYCGELGPVFSGCYSACHEVKNKVAAALQRLNMAESLGASAEELEPAWKELLFHHFHDILPGTSVREAYERDVFPGLGFVQHTANYLIDRELCRHDTAADTTFMTEGGIQVWNAHPVDTKGIVSFDGFTDPNNTGSDFNILRSADGKEIPMQQLPSATSYGPCGDGWARLTAVVPLEAMTETYLAYGRSDNILSKQGFERQQALLSKLSFAVFYDNTRTWGFGLKSFNQMIGEAERLSVEEFQDGAVCSILRANYRYKMSTLTLDLVAYAGIEEIQIRLNLNWHETQCCLKLVLDHGEDEALFVTGACLSLEERLQSNKTASRHWVDGKNESLYVCSDERAMIDWCSASVGSHHTGFYAADLHSCDHHGGRLRLTLLRPVLYADHEPFAPAKESGWMDLGQIQLQLWFFDYPEKELSWLPGLAQLRLQNAETHEVTMHQAGAPYRSSCPTVKASSPSIVLTVGPSTVYALNYGADDETFCVNDISYTLPAKSLKIISI